MRIALYFELFRWRGGKLFKKQGTGLASSFRNQLRALQRVTQDDTADVKIEVVEGPRLDVDVLQLNVPWLKSRWLMRRAKRKNIRVLLYAHTTVEDARGVIPGIRLIAPLYRRYLSSAYRSADRVICPSHYTRDLLIAHYGVSKERAVVISNGVDSKKFVRDEQKRQEVRKIIAPQNETVIGTVALVMPRKGLDTWLELARTSDNSQLPRKFVWVGKFFSSQGKRLTQHAPKNTLFTGFVPDVTAYYSAMDIFVFPSYEENQGMAILEAASSGLPIIVRDLPVYRGWLVHGENCLIAKTEADFEKFVSQLIADAAMRKKISNGALILARNNDLKKIGLTLQALYLRLLAG